MATLLAPPLPSAVEPRTASAPPALPALTSIRFFAALGVVLFHFTERSRWPAPLRDLVGRGYMGVPLFFILSGFVLGYNYFPRARAGRFAMRRFWTARAARIYPVYLLALGLLAPFVVSQYRGHISRAALAGSGLASTLMLQSWIPGWRDYWNTPGWTLSIEAFFYLAFPLLLGIAFLNRRAASVAVTAAALLTAVTFGLDHPGASWAARVPWTYLPMFLLGMVLARAHELRLAARLQGALAIAAAALMVYTIVGHGVPAAQIDRVCTLLAGLLVYGLAGSGGALARLLAWAPLLLLGEASYSLYILQAPLWARLNQLRTWEVRSGRLGPGWAVADGPFLAVLLLVSVLFSLAVHHWFEQPLRAGLRRRAAHVQERS